MRPVGRILTEKRLSASALTRLKAGVGLADDKDPATASDHATVPVAFLKRF